MCSRDQVFSHTCDGRGLQTVPKDECEREGTCSAEVMFILKQMVGWPGRQSLCLRWMRGTAGSLGDERGGRVLEGFCVDGESL